MFKIITYKSVEKQCIFVVFLFNKSIIKLFEIINKKIFAALVSKINKKQLSYLNVYKNIRNEFQIRSFLILSETLLHLSTIMHFF